MTAGTTFPHTRLPRPAYPMGLGGPTFPRYVTRKIEIREKGKKGKQKREKIKIKKEKKTKERKEIQTDRKTDRQINRQTDRQR